MTKKTIELGERIPLSAPASLSPNQQSLYQAINEQAVPWAEASGFVAKLEDGSLIGPFNVALQSPEIGAAFWRLQGIEAKNTTLNGRVRQVVILTVGSAWDSAYELYAHTAVARKAGLSEESVVALAKGEQAPGLTEEEKLAQSLTKQLTLQHQVPQETFDQAKVMFGIRGIVDMLFLAGCYDMVCSLLNTFEVPVPGNQPNEDNPAQIALEGSHLMSHNKAPQARLITVAELPTQYFLENLAVREDNSVLINVANQKELWYVPPADADQQVEPVHLHTYKENAGGIVEIEPDVFLLLTGNAYTTHESFLHRLNLRNWKPGTPIGPEFICQFPERARGVNGACLLGPRVVLVADCFAALIWRLDFPLEGGQPSFRVWLEHESMGYFAGKMKPEQPGVNGVRYATKTNYLYYTATAKKLFMRVKVNPETIEPADSPELVVAGRMGDDFLIDEDAQVIYLTTHRQNTIDVVSMDPGLNSGFTQSIAGQPYTEEMIGPSAGAWRRGPQDRARVAYFITDGGTASPPPDGKARPAKLLRVELQPLRQGFPG